MEPPITTRPISRLTHFSTLLLLFLSAISSFNSTEAYDSLDPNGNITITWDIKEWMADGYLGNLEDVPCLRKLKLCSQEVCPPLRNEPLYLGYEFYTNTGALTSGDGQSKSILLWSLLMFHDESGPMGKCQYAMVSIHNYQQYRHIQAPGWTLGWTWAKKEVIWNIMGAQTTEQGDCSRFKGNIPHCCKKDPTVVDLLLGTPYNLQVANCCKSGIISSLAQDPVNALSAFQVSAGLAGTTNKTVRLPKNFTLKTPGPGYTCGAAKIVEPTKFISRDGRRTTQAMMTWNVTCTYSQFLAQKSPTCCVSLSSFYNDTIVNCPKCTCGCQNNLTQPGSCVEGNSPYLATVMDGLDKKSLTPLVQCTPHMCPIRVHWHVKVSYKEYWRVKVTVTNFNYRTNYSQWNMVIQHPNFDNLTTIFSFNYKSLTPYANINDTAMLWGIKYYNDLLMAAGPSGNVQSELLFRKASPTFTFEKGWAFPRRVYFNGDNCVMPPPDAYPWLPNSGPRSRGPLLLPLMVFLTALAFSLSYL